MDEIIDGLIFVLEHQKKLYSELLKLSAAKKEAIPSGRVEQLDKIVREEQMILMSLGDMERKRKRMSRELSIEAGGGPKDEMTISDIMAFASAEQAQKLGKIQSELGEIVEEQIKYNETNKKLLESRIEYINYMINMVSENFDASSTYSSEGAEGKRKEQKINIIDASV